MLNTLAGFELLNLTCCRDITTSLACNSNVQIDRREQHRRDIHDSISAAQRGGEYCYVTHPCCPRLLILRIVLEATQAIRAVGTGSGGQSSFALSHPWPMKFRQLASPSQFPSGRSGPQIAMPGYARVSENTPNFFKKTGDPGYQDAHEQYIGMRSYYANLAYKNQNHELIIVKAALVVLKSGRAKAMLIEVIHNSSLPLR